MLRIQKDLKTPRRAGRVARLLSSALTVAFTATAADAQTFGTAAWTRDDFNARCAFTASTIDPTCVTDADGLTSFTTSQYGGTFGFTAKAQATVGGPLKAQATVTVQDVPLNTAAAGQPRNGTDRYQAQARAEYFDQVIIAGPQQVSSLRIFFSIDGFAGQSSLDPRSASFGDFRVARFGSAPINGTAPNTAPLASRGVAAPTDGSLFESFLDIPVVGGTNYLLFSVNAVARVGAPLGTAAGDTWSGTAFADYFNTVTLLGTSLVDVSGNVVSGASATFAGAPTLNVVPEPASFALLVAGFVALGMVSGRRRATTR